MAIEWAEIKTILVILTIVLLNGYIYWFFVKTFKYWKARNVPFLKPTIPFGSVLNYYLNKLNFGEFFAKSYLELKNKGYKHGGLFFFWKPVYIPTDPEIIKKILITDAENFANRGFYTNVKDDPLSGHIFNMEDGEWRTFRSKLPQAFTSVKIKRMFLMMVEISKTLKAVVEELETKSDPVEIKSLLSRYSMDVISTCTFGTNSNTLLNENEELLIQAKNFFKYQWNLFKNTLVVIIPRNVLKNFKFKLFIEETENYVFNMFKKVYDYKKSNKNNMMSQDLAEIFMKLTEKNCEEKDFSGKRAMKPMTIQDFSSQMFAFLSAGFETSSSVITFALYELSKNQDYQNKLREEINRVLTKYDDEISYEAVMEMKYLEAIVDETLRLYPVVPVLPRVCKKDYKVVETDLILQEGMLVMISNMGLQRDPEYYEDPDKFIPDRFLPGNKKSRPFVSNLPFGEGPRICIGKRFALLQTKIGLLTVIRNNKITLNKKTTEGVRFSSWELILRKTGNVWVNIEKIKN